MSYHISHRDAAMHDLRFHDNRQQQFSNRHVNDMNDYPSYMKNIGHHQPKAVQMQPRSTKQNGTLVSRGIPVHYTSQTRNPPRHERNIYEDFHKPMGGVHPRHRGGYTGKTSNDENRTRSQFASVSDKDFSGEIQYQSIETPYQAVEQRPQHQTFNRDTKTMPNQEKRVHGNRTIMDYHIFSPKYEQHSYKTELMFGGIGDSLNENRRQASIDFNNEFDVKREMNNFNEAVDNLGIGIDLRRPMATRDQAKDYHKFSENKNEGFKNSDVSDETYGMKLNQKTRMASNRYLESRQFDNSGHVNQGEEDITSFNPIKKTKNFEFATSSPIDGGDDTWMF